MKSKNKFEVWVQEISFDEGKTWRVWELHEEKRSAGQSTKDSEEEQNGEKYRVRKYVPEK